MNAIAPVPVQAETGEPRGTELVAFMRSRLFDRNANFESIHAVFLDAQRRFLGEIFLPGDGVASFRMRLRDVLAKALSFEAHGLVIAHNHPSGKCYPSKLDVEATHRLSEIARALDIQLLDHLIITQDSAYSMRAKGEI